MSSSEAVLDSISSLTMRERLLALVRKAMGAPGASRPLAVDARLSELGISSIKMVGLMLAIEAEFNITIAQSEITPENFASIASIEAMLDRILGRSNQ
jgi:acyl carrier protein